MPPWPRRVCSSYFPRRRGCCGPMLMLAAVLSFSYQTPFKNAAFAARASHSFECKEVSQTLWDVPGNRHRCQLLNVVMGLYHARLHGIGSRVELANVRVGRLRDEIVQ